MEKHRSKKVEYSSFHTVDLMISVIQTWTYVPLASASFRYKHVTQYWSVRNESMKEGGKGRGEAGVLERLMLIKCSSIIVMFQIIGTT